VLDPLSITVPLPKHALQVQRPQRKLLTPSPDHADDYIIELDYSSMSEIIRCHRAGENVLIRGREANRDRAATDFGTLFHKLEETRRRAGGLTDEAKVKQTESIVSHFISHPVPPSDHRTADRMVSVIKLYNEKYALDGTEKKIFHDAAGPFIERPFKVELATVEVNDYLPYNKNTLLGQGSELDAVGLFVRNLHIFYTGRIDCVLEEASNLWVWDDKTTSRGGREFSEAFRLSLQTRGYAWALQKIAQRPVLGCIVNAVIVRPLTKTGTGTEFNRMNYFYSQDSLAEWEDNAKAIVTDFVAMLQRGFFPQYARSFISPCMHCDFSDNCALPRDQRAADLASDLYRDVVWNPMNEN
jgi:hypothetical protein